MKFVLAYTFHPGGSSAEFEETEKRSMQILGKWQPSVQVSEWVDRLDGNGGFAVFEADDPALIMKDIAVWAPFLHFDLYPVLDVGEATPVQQEAMDFRDGIS
ncbi:MAG TPA: DUF3303 family protein [Acidimicrobiia bacterium]|nr:DUF3303 family protein [Acidimicrobiia bacterium]